ncbi:MAG: acetyl-CoA carboxylase carboxyl transferase subunit alpha, partial [Algoriella sp.]
MKLTGTDMLELGLIEDIIKEPLGGAHYKPEVAYTNLKNKVLETYNELKKLSPKELQTQRQERFINFGEYSG